MSERSMRQWLDELAMHIVEGRAKEALQMLRERYPHDMEDEAVVRLLARVRGTV